jgi:hypothetical protein
VHGDEADAVAAVVARRRREHARRELHRRVRELAADLLARERDAVELQPPGPGALAAQEADRARLVRRGELSRQEVEVLGAGHAMILLPGRAASKSDSAAVR